MLLACPWLCSTLAVARLYRGLASVSWMNSCSARLASWTLPLVGRCKVALVYRQSMFKLYYHLIRVERVFKLSCHGFKFVPKIHLEQN